MYEAQEGYYQIMNTERCSCGAREKNKCSKESEHKTGKMCLKDDNGTGVLKTSTRYLDTGEVIFGDDIIVTTPFAQPLFNITPKWWNKENAS